jgi:hypothetical protein
MPPTGGAGALPPTYVFEDLRGVLLDHVLRADLILTGLAINSLLFAATAVGFARGCSPARDGREPYCKWGNRNRICTRRRNIRPRSGGIVRLHCLTR